MDQGMGSDLAVRKVVVLIERLRIVAGLTLSGRDGFPDLVDVTGRTFELVLLRFRHRDSESVIAELPPKTGIFSIMMTFLRPRSSASFSTKVAAMPESTITVSHSSSRRTSETFFVTAGPPARVAPRKPRSPSAARPLFGNSRFCMSVLFGGEAPPRCLVAFWVVVSVEKRDQVTSGRRAPCKTNGHALRLQAERKRARRTFCGPTFAAITVSLRTPSRTR